MNLLEKNVGKTDRVVRLVLGAASLAGGYLALSGLLSYAVMFVGLILLVTGAMGSCALYSVLKINTGGK